MRLKPIACVALIACGGGDAQCLLYPCAIPTAVLISVSSPFAPTGIANVAITVAGQTTATPCTNEAVSICRVMGGTGDYSFQISAPGYIATTQSVHVTGTNPGCNTCGQIDTQRIAITLQRATP